MIIKTIIDLLSEENLELSVNQSLVDIDDTFIPQHQVKDSEANDETILSSRKKLQILDWLSLDRQLRNFGYSKIDKLCLDLISEDSKKHVNIVKDSRNGNGAFFDFGSDTIPFAVKYNVAIALSYRQAISILSNHDSCEIYASEEVKRVFRKNGITLHAGLNKINFNELPLAMKKDLIWPMMQNLYRSLTIRKAAQVFPEGVPGKLAYEALTSDCEDQQLASHLSNLDALKYSDYETIYFSDLDDLEVKYHVALYCLNHLGEIKPKQHKKEEEPDQEKEDEIAEDEEEASEKIKALEEEYMNALKRLNKNKSFWDKLNLGDILQMGKDVMEAIKEEIRDFALLKQAIIYRLSGKSKVAVENDELIRIASGKNPSFGFASQYLAMFFHPKDYYTILGLDSLSQVKEKEVKDAFKKLAKIYHPDKNPNAPDKEIKEEKFKLLIEAKNALLNKLGSGKEFRDDSSLTNYLGNISKLFEKYTDTVQEEFITESTDEKDSEMITHNSASLDDEYQEVVELETDINSNQNIEQPENYLGPYLEEMLILESMVGNWKGKEILVLGAGVEPEEFSMPVILAKLGAKVTATDVNYRGPSEYQNCQYYRVSADRIDTMFLEERFDIVISTAMFGAPFTNWAIRQYFMSPVDINFSDRIRQLELETLSKLLRLTKKGGIHFHYNKDLNPQSWNFDESDLIQLGCESAFHPENLPNSRGIWFLKKMLKNEN